MGQIWDYAKTSVRVLFILSTIALFAFPIVYPAVMAAPVDSPPDVPQECESASSRVVQSPSEANVTATAELEPGGFVNISYDISDTSGLNLGLSTDELRVNESEGFTEITFGSTDLRANRSAEDHWIRYQMPSSGQEIGRYPSGDDWAIARAPDHLSENVYLEAADAGYIGSSTLYLGEFETDTRTVGCQEFTVVVPEQSESAVDTTERLDDLESAARRLPGQKFESIHVFISPVQLGDENRLGGFVRGFNNEIVIVEEYPHETVVWMHEYVHTLQNTRPEPDLAWATEGNAMYLAVKTAVDAGRITPLEYDYWMSRAESGNETSDAPLVDPEQRSDEYSKGAAVLQRMDSDLKEQSNKSIDDVFLWINEHPHPGYNDLKNYLRDAGLSNETVNSYDPIVLEGDVGEIEYRHGHSELPEPVWKMIPSILSDEGRYMGIAGLGVHMILGGWSVWNWISFDPDDIEF